MSRKYLGQPFDIHTGGIDHISIHHQNEIAQSEVAYDTPLANYWMHCEFVNVPSGKMAKSGENFITLRTLQEKGVHPLAYRYYLLQAHYRSPIAFSWEALEAAQNAYFKLIAAIHKMQGDKIQDINFGNIINDDMDTPKLIAEIWKLLKERNGGAILNADNFLGLDIENQSRKLAEEMNAVPKEIKEKVSRREIARRNKNFSESDAIRNEIRSAGYEIMDTDEGPIVRKSTYSF
jgi:cysteinyl-tRNA synthetase